jgi:hypothetical protein
MTTRANRRFLLLMMVATMPGAALLGCSHSKAPTPAPAASAPARSTSAGSAPTAANSAASAQGSAATGSAGATSSSHGAPERADLVLLAGAAFDGCKAPSPPPDPPDGHVATRAQMLSSHKATADFNSATNDYLTCLDKAANSFTRQYGPILPVSSARQVVALRDRIHNQAVGADQAVADKFNTQLRLYKGRGGAT